MIVSLVEDDPTVLTLLAELLKNHGFDPRQILIEHADTVTSGLDRLAAENATVVVMDLGMPVPGEELLAAAQADPRFQGVRFVVATASFDGAERIPKSPIVQTVAKPYDLPELLSALGGSRR